MWAYNPILTKLILGSTEEILLKKVILRIVVCIYNDIMIKNRWV